MAVPYTFGSATTSIPLSQLDSNFATTITLGNTAIQLGNTVTTLNNMTLANVTISSGTSNLSSTSIANGTSNVTVNSSGGNITLGTAGTTAITINTSQQVGINNTSPSAPLDVTGTIKSSTYSQYGSSMYYGIGNALSGSFSSSDLLMYNAANGILGFLTNNSEKARIDANGNFCINSTSVVGAEKLGVKFDGSTINGIGVQTTASSGGDGFVVFRNSAGTAIGTISRVTTTNAVAYNTTSDQRLKSNITDSQSVIDKLMSVKVRQFDWTEGDLHQDYGFIAQELEPTLSGVVTRGKTDEDMWQLDYSKLTPHLVKAIQELKAINDQQAETINALTARVVALEAK